MIACELLSKNEIFASVNNQMVGEKRIRRYRSRAFYSRKCKREMGTTNIDSLPDELLLEILARLSDDPDHLYNKGRLVCRRWCDLIHSHDFITTQLHRSTYDTLMVRWSDRADFVTATQGRIETSEISCKIPLPPDSELESTCNGLVLHWHNRARALSIINPVTRQQFIFRSLRGKNIIIHGLYCLGYAADSMEYKVAVAHERTGSRLKYLSILSVGRDKSWRSVGVEHLSTDARMLLSEDAFVIDGSLIIWINSPSGRFLILDVETEILTLHPSRGRPDPEASLVGTSWVYLSTGRSLSLLVMHSNTYLMELWEMTAETREWSKVMDDIKLGSQEQWLRQFSFGGVLIPFGWIRYPEVLAFHTYHPRAACIFNLNTLQISSMEFPKNRVFEFSHAYKKSLAWFTIEPELKHVDWVDSE